MPSTEVEQCASEAFLLMQIRHGRIPALEEILMTDGAALFEVEDVPAMVARRAGSEASAHDIERFREELRAYAIRAARNALEDETTGGAICGTAHGA